MLNRKGFESKELKERVGNQTQLSDESVLFAERATSVQVNEKVITEAKSKIKEQISLILSMLERWLLD